MAETPPLTFSTLTEGQPVVIDGQTHQIRHPDSLSIGAAQRIEQVRGRVMDLLQQKDRPVAADEDISRGLAVVCRGILDAPDEVQARLSDAQRILIMQSFTRLRSALPVLAGAVPSVSPRTGTRSSRGSRGSTAGRRSPGSGTSRAA